MNAVLCKLQQADGLSVCQPNPNFTALLPDEGGNENVGKAMQFVLDPRIRVAQLSERLSYAVRQHRQLPSACTRLVLAPLPRILLGHLLYSYSHSAFRIWFGSFTNACNAHSHSQKKQTTKSSVQRPALLPVSFQIMYQGRIASVLTF